MTVTTSDALVLVTPEGWLVDDLGVARMRRLLATRPDLVGVTTTTGPLPPGSSVRVHAEQLARRALVAGAAVDGPLGGAVLLRSDVPYERTDTGIVVPGGGVVRDDGAHAHDPWAPPALPLAPADAAGRPPFRRRPVVVLLQTQANADEDLGDWARRLVNGLVRRDVEGRLAMVDVSPGLHLTRPCAPTEESIHALRPDLVVALDEGAADVAPSWCAGSRSTVLVDLALDPALTVELVSWQIGHDRGRWRARIGQAVDAAPLAELANRLASGPQPVPPPRSGSAAPAPVQLRPRTPVPATMAVVAADEAGASPRIDAFGMQAHAAGLVVTTTSDVDGALDGDLVIVDATTPFEVAVAVARRRRERGRLTIVDVVQPDVDTDLSLLLESAGLAVTPGERGRERVQLIGVPALVLPTLLTPVGLLQLEAARDLDPAPPPTTFGVVRAVGAAVPDALTEALQRFRADVDVDVRESGPDGPGLAAMAGWRAGVWVGAPDSLDGRPRAVVEAALLGVPMVFARDDAPDVVDPVLARHSVTHRDDVDDWLAALRLAIDPTAPSRRRVSTRAEALFGRKASVARVQRVVGWARRAERVR